MHSSEQDTRLSQHRTPLCHSPWSQHLGWPPESAAAQQCPHDPYRQPNAVGCSRTMATRHRMTHMFYLDFTAWCIARHQNQHQTVLFTIKYTYKAPTSQIFAKQYKAAHFNNYHIGTVHAGPFGQGGPHRVIQSILGSLQQPILCGTGHGSRVSNTQKMKYHLLSCSHKNQAVCVCGMSTGSCVCVCLQCTCSLCRFKKISHLPAAAPPPFVIYWFASIAFHFRKAYS